MKTAREQAEEIVERNYGSEEMPEVVSYPIRHGLVNAITAALEERERETLERIRDLVALERKLGNTKAQLAEAVKLLTELLGWEVACQSLNPDLERAIRNFVKAARKQNS